MSNELPRLAVIGIGDHGSRHVDQLLTMQDQAVIDTVVDENPGNIAALREKHGADLSDVHVSRDWEAVFTRDHSHIDAVISCLPDQYHIEVASAAVETSKHLLGEKPLATTMVEYARLKQLLAQAEAKKLVFLPCNPRETAGPWQALMELVHDRDLLANHFGELGNAAIGSLGSMQSLRTLIHYAASREGKQGHASAAADKLNHEVTTLCRLTPVVSFDRAFLLDNRSEKYSASLMTASGLWLTTQALRVGTRHKDRGSNMYHESAEVLFANAALGFDASAGTMTLRLGEHSIVDTNPRYRKNARGGIGAMTRHFLARMRGEEADRFGDPEYLKHTALLSTLASLALENASLRGNSISV